MKLTKLLKYFSCRTAPFPPYFSNVRFLKEFSQQFRRVINYLGKTLKRDIFVEIWIIYINDTIFSDLSNHVSSPFFVPKSWKISFSSLISNAPFSLTKYFHKIHTTVYNHVTILRPNFAKYFWQYFWHKIGLG